MSKKKEKDVVDFTDRFDKLLDKKKKMEKKEWNKQWDALMKEFIGDEERGKKEVKGGAEEKGQGTNVGTVQGDLGGETTV